MTITRQIPVIGIIGGVAAGKSTVAAEFARLGCAVIDADRIAHELLNEPDVKSQVAACFGRDVLDGGGSIDRHKLADLVFADGEKLAKLSDILHPLVLEQAEQLMKVYAGQPQLPAIILDMPLLVEVGWHKRCDRVVFVDCARAKRVERAQKTGPRDQKKLEIRENFQISLDKKAKLSDNTVDNNSVPSALAKQVAEILTCVMGSG